jgi:hypothetical protein
MGPRHLSGGVLLVLSSALLYLTFFLSILAPVPLILVRLARGRIAALGATLLNMALVFMLSGRPGFIGYAVLTVATAWMVSELAVLLSGTRPKVEEAPRALFRLLSRSALGVALVLVATIAIWAHTAQVSPWVELGKGLDWLGEQMIAQSPSGSMDAADWAAQKEEWLRSLPSSLSVALILQCWVAMTLMLRLNPGRIRDRLAIPASFHRLWKNPEWLVWSVIVSGFGALVLSGPTADAAGNLLNVMLTFYGLQGLAILGGIFDLWKLRGFGRALAFFLVFTVMIPLVLALGFFDLWFDFRAKLRQL